MDAITAGIAQETPAYRASTEAAAFGPDFAGRGQAASVARRTAEVRLPRPSRTAAAQLNRRLFSTQRRLYPFARFVSKTP